MIVGRKTLNFSFSKNLVYCKQLVQNKQVIYVVKCVTKLVAINTNGKNTQGKQSAIHN